MRVNENECDTAGILLIDKPRGKTAFSLVGRLRKYLGIKKIGHAGTLDPFATGVMVMLIGKSYTRRSDQLLCQDKEYLAEAFLGITTDTYDCEGLETARSSLTPSCGDVETILNRFQGEIDQVPPMYSAKKQKGKKLYELARQGLTVERPPVKVRVALQMIDYSYPKLTFRVSCSKGTYIRSLAYDIGEALGCGAHLSALQRTRSGPFLLGECMDGALLDTVDLPRDYLLSRLRSL